MCRIDEKIYVRADGHRSVFQDPPSYCEKARQRKKMCSRPEVRRTEYPDPTSSPIPSSPLTPGFTVRERRPSTSSRPSTRDGSIKSLKPQIHIEINGGKKGKGTSYIPSVTVTTGKTHRSSMGSSSAYESPGSEGSRGVRTGYPDAPAPPLSSSFGGLHSRPGHLRNPSSDESYNGLVYHSSDAYDTPSLATGTTATSSSTRPIIHNGPRHVPSAVDTTRTTRGQAGSPASPYRVTEFAPSDRTERSHRPTSSHSIHAAPEIVGHGEDRERRRAEARRLQEALDREVAATVMREENAKQVRFETDRAKLRAEQRAENNFAAHEQRRADERERIRRQEKKQREAEAAREAAAKQAKSTASKPKSSRRNSASVSAAEAAKQQQLLAAEARQMEKERRNAAALDREEQMHEQMLQQQQLQRQQYLQQTQPPREPSLQERQQDPGYYDPRGARPTVPTGQPPVIRRPSQSGQRPNLGRTPSTRGTAPQIREDRRQPPVAYYNNGRADLPPARERRPSSSHGSNPYTQPGPVSADPWDVRNVGHALPSGQTLPSARGPGVGHTFPQPQHATQRMNQVLYSDSEDDYPSRRR